MSAVIPIVPVHRVLLPGAHMTVSLPPGTAGDLSDPGIGRVVVVLRRAEGADLGHAVGTIATVSGRRVTDDGVLLLRLVGVARTEIPGAAAGTENDPVGEEAAAQQARAAAVKALRGYLAALAEHGKAVDILDAVPADPVAASYRVASLLEVSAPELQAVLAAPTAQERLGLLEAILRREAALLRATF